MFSVMTTMLFLRPSPLPLRISSLLTEELSRGRPALQEQTVLCGFHDLPQPSKNTQTSRDCGSHLSLFFGRPMGRWQKTVTHTYVDTQIKDTLALLQAQNNVKRNTLSCSSFCKLSGRRGSPRIYKNLTETHCLSSETCSLKGLKEKRF